MLRWQLLPKIVVDAGVCEFRVQRRTSGGITGSRTAGAAGRIPVEDAVRAVASNLQAWGSAWAERLRGRVLLMLTVCSFHRILLAVPSETSYWWKRLFVRLGD